MMNSDYLGYAIAWSIAIYIIGFFVVLRIRCNTTMPVLRDMTYCIFWPIFLIKVTIITVIRLVIDVIKALVTL